MSNIDKLEENLKKMAKHSYWQNLYKFSKECSNIQLFENVSNFSGLQVRFLYYLALYDMLFEELSKHEDDLLTENVLNDSVRTEAYLIYRNKKHDYLWKKYRREEKLAEHKNKHSNKHKSGNTSMIEVDLRRE